MIDVYLSKDPLGQSWNCVEDGPTFMVDGAPWRLVNRHRLWRPPTDIYETDETIVVRLEVAGMKEEDFSVTLRERQLYICGTRNDVPERRAYHQMEIPFGQFAIEIELPAAVKHDNVAAFYRDGFLKITLIKAATFTIQIVEETNS